MYNNTTATKNMAENQFGHIFFAADFIKFRITELFYKL